MSVCAKRASTMFITTESHCGQIPAGRDARAVSLTGRSYTYGTQVADANRYMAAVAVGPQLVTFSVGGRAPSSLSNLAIEQPLACPERATSAARHDR